MDLKSVFICENLGFVLEQKAVIFVFKIFWRPILVVQYIWHPYVLHFADNATGRFRDAIKTESLCIINEINKSCMIYS